MFADTIKPRHCKAAPTPPSAHSVPHQSDSQVLHRAADKQLSWHSGLSPPQCPPGSLSSPSSRGDKIQAVRAHRNEPGREGQAPRPLLAQSVPGNPTPSSCQHESDTALWALLQHSQVMAPQNPTQTQATAAKQHTDCTVPSAGT